MKNIIGLGEILWDMFPEGKVLGGAPANFAYHAGQLGHNGYAVSAVGKDALGDEIFSVASQKHFKHIIEITDFPTGTVQVKLDKRGVPEYEICENVAWDNIPFSDQMKELAAKADAVCFGSLAQRNLVSRQSIRDFIASTPDNCLRIFDINLRQDFYTKEVIDESIQIANILKINDEELNIVSKLFGFNSDDEKEVIRLLMIDCQLDILILTKGADGSCVFTQDESSFLPTPKVQVADTVGAGDAFTAAFVTSLLDGGSISQAHQLAVKVSAYLCTQHGAMPILPKGLV